MSAIEQDKLFETSTFKWPSPPFFKTVGGPEKKYAESCIVELLDRPPITGKLIKFSPDAQRLLVQRANDNSNLMLSFADIKNIQLLSAKPIELDNQFLKNHGGEVYAPSEKQPYQIVFIDKTKISGETMGYVKKKSGLYLFPTAKNNKIEKHFIPHQAIKDYQIGDKIGNVLINENHATVKDIEQALAHQKSLKTQHLNQELNSTNIFSASELRRAINMNASKPEVRLESALKDLKLASEDQINSAREKQRSNRHLRLGEILVSMGVIDEATLNGALAKKLGIPYVKLSKFNFDPVAIKMIDAMLVLKHALMPLCLHENKLVIAFQDATDYKVIEELSYLIQTPILPAMASLADIQKAADRHYKISKASWDKAKSNSTAITPDLDKDELAQRLGEGAQPQQDLIETVTIESDNTLVKLVNKIILDAAKEKASDIHIETQPDNQNTLVRFRKDGTLMPYLEFSGQHSQAIITRIKVMASLDISEHRKPQDGKIDFKKQGENKIELRIATIPTSNGLEDVVMRILASSKPLPIEDLGLSAPSLKNLKKIAAKPYGLVLVCGPTGSGKTTSLHSILGHINQPERKIWTAEDPIEITQKGLRQVQVNSKIGWTFSAAMRSFLRADPDVIMVGEMRDQETIKIGIEASLTGHLVLSTLHTNSAPESVTRMLDMGMDPFNFSDALLGVLAQRLAKSLCPACKKAYQPSEEELKALAEEYSLNTPLDSEKVMTHWQQRLSQSKSLTLHQAVGCEACNQSGYSGRIGLYELMTVTPVIKSLIKSSAETDTITNSAIKEGMLTLKQDGILKILQGKTDIQQVRAVCT